MAGGAAAPWVLRASGSRPDILIISIEDCSPLMGCYGHPIVRTPNIDALADRGVRFHHAYCTAPVCNPSRAAVMTGLRPPTLDCFTNSVDWRVQIPSGRRTMAEHFQDNGYETVRLGKITHAPRLFAKSFAEGEAREQAMWDGTLDARGEKPRIEPHAPSRPRPAVLKADDYNARSLRWGGNGLEPEEDRDGRIARRAAEFLKEQSGKPLFFTVGFHAPHYPQIAPDRFINMYRPEDIVLPRDQGDLDDVPGKFGVFNTVDEGWLTDDEKRGVIAAHYATISYVDWCVGVLMAGLEESGRSGNTLVCLWSDHGLHMGEHGLWRKETLFEGATRVAFLMAGPGIQRGKPCRRVTELVDIYPTLADLAGVGVPEDLDSDSMRPILTDPDAPWKKAAFTYGRNSRTSLRTERWRYTHWGEPGHEELYDHESDSREHLNVAAASEHRATLEEMRKLMEGGWRAARPKET